MACGGDDDDSSDEPLAGSVYVLATAVSSNEGANTYVKVLDSLEPLAERLDLSTAREFAGWSDIKVSGGKVFVSSGEAPTITRFAVDDTGQLVEEATISFADYTDQAELYSCVFVHEEKAYMTADDGSRYIVWNPVTMEITGTIELPPHAPQGAIQSSYALDRGMVLRGNRLYHASTWMDYTEYLMGDSTIVVVDTDTDQVITDLTSDCPALDGGTLDDDGDLYFSNWVYSPGATLINEQRTACMVKIPAGSDALDASWKMSFADVTEGREAAAFVHLGGGKGVLSVFHDENATYVPEDGIFDYVFGAHWRFWSLDLESRTATPIEGLDWHSGGYYLYAFDGKSYLLTPGAGYTSTTVLELDASGTYRKILETDGWSTKLQKVR